MSTKTTKTSFQEEITQQFITAFEQFQSGEKQTEWSLPWHQMNRLPWNPSTGNEYSGVNILQLASCTVERTYRQPIFATYKQWQEMDCQVKKGEKGTRVIFFNPITEQDAKTGKDVVKGGFVRSYTVFNADQVDGYELPVPPKLTQIEINEAAESFVSATGVEIEHGGDRACYNRLTDKISMPEKGQFIGQNTASPTQAYYSVLFHELIHWSGAKDRSEREKGTFGSPEYAFEELVAEIGASYLCAEFGFSSGMREDHLGYIAHWIKVLENDKNAIIRAASLAGKAVQWLREYTQTPEPVTAG